MEKEQKNARSDTVGLWINTSRVKVVSKFLSSKTILPKFLSSLRAPLSLLN